jgi:uncharacterized protein YgbK (DUF1537 family)
MMALIAHKDKGLFHQVDAIIIQKKIRALTAADARKRCLAVMLLSSRDRRPGRWRQGP